MNAGNKEILHRKEDIDPVIDRIFQPYMQDIVDASKTIDMANEGIITQVPMTAYLFLNTEEMKQSGMITVPEVIEQNPDGTFLQAAERAGMDDTHNILAAFASLFNILPPDQQQKFLPLIEELHQNFPPVKEEVLQRVAQESRMGDYYIRGISETAGTLFESTRELAAQGQESGFADRIRQQGQNDGQSAGGPGGL